MKVAHGVRISILGMGLMLVPALALGIGSPAIASDAVAAELTPGVEISSGTDVGVITGTQLDLELTPTGPGTFLKLYNIPGWVDYDWTTQRVTGTAPPTPGVHQFTIIARNDHDAISKTVTLTVRPQMLSDATLADQTFRLIFEGYLKPSETKMFVEECPTSHPFLVYQVLSEGALVSKGVRVQEFGEVTATSWGETERDFPDGHQYLTGSQTSLTNWSPANSAWVKIDLLCSYDSTDGTRWG